MNKYNFEHDCPFEVFITKTQKSKEDAKLGEWIKLPTTTENLQEVYKRIGIVSAGEELFISDYDIYVDGLYYYLTNQSQTIDELNKIAKLIDDMDDFKYNLFCKELHDREDIQDFQGALELALNI